MEPIANVDGLIDLARGLGTSADPLTQLQLTNPFLGTSDIDYNSNMFASFGLLKNLVTLKPEQATSTWCKFNLNDDPVVQAKVQEFLDGQTDNFREAQIEGNKNGDGFLVILADDGRPYDEPIDLAALNDIEIYPRVFNKLEVRPDSKSVIANPLAPKFYHFTFSDFDLETEIDAQIIHNGFIHRDRVIRFKGYRLGGRGIRLNQGLNQSYISVFMRDMLRYSTGVGYAAVGLSNYETTLYPIPNFLSIVKNKEERDKLTKGMQAVEQIRSILNAVLYHVDGTGNGQPPSILARKFENIDNVLESVKDAMCASAFNISGLTRSEFFGEQPTGLGSAGEALSDRVQSDEQRIAQQKRDFNAEIKWLSKLKLNSKNFLTRGNEPEGWSIVWPSNITMTPLEKSEQKERDAKTDAIRVNDLGYSQEEIRISRHGQGTYSDEIQLMDTGPRDDEALSVNGRAKDLVSLPKFQTKDIDVESLIDGNYPKRN